MKNFKAKEILEEFYSISTEKYTCDCCKQEKNCISICGTTDMNLLICLDCLQYEKN